MNEFSVVSGRGVVRGALATMLILCANAASAVLPDLIINRSRLATGIEITEQNFAASDCGVIESCVKGTGTRKLLLFEVAFVNIGKGDLVIGSPHDNSALFEFSPCHGHHHLSSAASYALFTSDGRSVNVARKQAFCLRDNAPYSSSSGPSHGYDCDNQGLTAGWEDIYPKNLDCQWLDITGLPGGTYTLKVTVNPSRVFAESNYGNNTAAVTVQIPGAPSATPPAVVTPPATSTPNYVKKSKSNKGKHKGWYKKQAKKKKKPAPRHR
jgi:hypothetical protein